MQAARGRCIQQQISSAIRVAESGCAHTANCLDTMRTISRGGDIQQTAEQDTCGKERKQRDGWCVSQVKLYV